LCSKQKDWKSKLFIKGFGIKQGKQPRQDKQNCFMLSIPKGDAQLLHYLGTVNSSDETITT
jgi:hypothetical protein